MLMTLALAACKNRSQILEFSGFSMGTTYNVVAVDHDNRLDGVQVKSAVQASLALVNQQLSNWDSASEISQFNASGAENAFSMSGDLANVMNASAEVNAASDGRFDTTIGPLIELWGFGAPGRAAMPNDDAIAQAMELSGQDTTLLLAGDQVSKQQAETQVYLAGIGKGYGADRVGAALQAMGINDYMIEIGGDLYAAGRNPDGLAWQIGIETPNPANRSVMNVVGLTGMGLATSGDYRNYFEVDGQRFSHLIDPTTGRPVTHSTASATVLADNAMLADAWSTAMLILGRERGLEIAAQHDIAVQFIENDRGAAQLSFTTSASAKFEAVTA